MDMKNSTIEFYKFLHKCNSYYNVRLRSIKIYEEEQEIRFHFAKERFIGNNTFFFDDDYFLTFGLEIAYKDEARMYEMVIEDICKRYSIKR